MSRLPHPGADAGNWGSILNDFLTQSLNNDGTIKNGSVGSSQLAPNAVTTAAIQDGAVTLDKMQGLASVAVSGSYTDLIDTPPVPSAPDGYIRVPGNSKFGTTDFYVMKYQAKNDGNGNAVSVAAGLPWVSISQIDAMTQSRALGPGYHLITEPEWMTIATNILYVNSNWTGGAVGSGILCRGHSDNNPATMLAASTDDTDGYLGTGNSVSAGPEQRRTLTLSNGEVIWDFSGNAYEWTDAWILGRDQPTTEGSTNGSIAREWTAINKRIGGLQYIMPTNRGWGAAQGMGKLYGLDDSVSSNSNTTQYAFSRGGSYAVFSTAGVFGVNLAPLPSGTNTSIGFRVACSI